MSEAQCFCLCHHGPVSFPRTACTAPTGRFLQLRLCLPGHHPGEGSAQRTTRETSQGDHHRAQLSWTGTCEVCTEDGLQRGSAHRALPRPCSAPARGISPTESNLRGQSYLAPGTEEVQVHEVWLKRQYHSVLGLVTAE